MSPLQSPRSPSPTVARAESPTVPEPTPHPLPGPTPDPGPQLPAPPKGSLPPGADQFFSDDWAPVKWLNDQHPSNAAAATLIKGAVPAAYTAEHLQRAARQGYRVATTSLKAPFVVCSALGEEVRSLAQGNDTMLNVVRNVPTLAEKSAAISSLYLFAVAEGALNTLWQAGLAGTCLSTLWLTTPCYALLGATKYITGAWR